MVLPPLPPPAFPRVLPGTMATASASPNEYEQLRARNIRANEEKLRELGIEQSIGKKVGPRTPAKRK